MAYIKGSDFVVRVMMENGYELIVGEISSNINLTMDTIEVTSKANEWKGFLGGKKGGTFSASLYFDDTMETQKALFNVFESGDKVECMIGSGEGDDKKGFVFDAFITSLTINAEKDGIVTVDASFQITGEITRTGF